MKKQHYQTMSDLPGAEGTERPKSIASFLISELSGAFGDLGTFLPLVIAILAVGSFDATGVMFGFGLFAIATGLVYRRPVPIQPMKFVAAVIIVGQLSAMETMASGLIMGVVLILLGVTGLIGTLQRFVPLSVLLGVQLGLGLQLSFSAFAMAGGGLGIALVLFGVLLLIPLLRYGHFVFLLILAGAVFWSHFFIGLSWPEFTGLHAPAFGWPGVDDFTSAVRVSFLPQIAMTISNAILLTALVAGDFYPKDIERVSPRNLSLTTGGFNLLLAPLGAIPMCHGAGGVAAHYKYGARSGLAPVLFGCVCLFIGLLAGPDATAWLAFLPLSLLAALLGFAGVQLINVSKLKTVRVDCYPVILIVALLGLLVDMSVGLVIGLVLEYLRRHVVSAVSRSVRG